MFLAPRPHTHTLPLLLVPLLTGCGAVSGVRTAFEMPTPAPPSPRELARMRTVGATNSLSRSLSKVSVAQIQSWLGADKPIAARAPRPILQPKRWAFDPARALVRDIQRGGDVPIAPQLILQSTRSGEPSTRLNQSFARSGGRFTRLNQSSTRSGESSTRLGESFTLPSRWLRGAGVSVGGPGDAGTRAFLASWAARESLRRADEEAMGRRALEDRVALLSRTTRTSVGLSGVSPATQLELSNLRLQLTPLLSATPARRAQAKDDIARIEARLNEIWREETDRQNALLRASTIEMPAKLRGEGEVALRETARADAQKSRARLAQVGRDLKASLASASAPPPALGLFQGQATAPNGAAAPISAPASGGIGGQFVLPPLAVAPAAIARRGQIRAGDATIGLSAKDARVWRAAAG